MNSIRWWHRILVGTDEQGNDVYTPGEVNHGHNGGDWPTTRFGIPEDCTGLNVIDIGGWDGFFSFEIESRGANRVLIVDTAFENGGNWGETKGFRFAKRILSSKVEFLEGDLAKLTDKDVGQFDLVICYGVLYHMKNPWSAFENLYSVTKPDGRLLVETAISPDKEIVLSKTPAWTFHPNFENITDYWYPNIAGLDSALKFANFREVKEIFRLDMPPSRATYTGIR
jgi:tRNA (mo5U34)-methyltransferase